MVKLTFLSLVIDETAWLSIGSNNPEGFNWLAQFHMEGSWWVGGCHVS